MKYSNMKYFKFRYSNLKFRTRAASITVLINWICNAIMGAVFPYMAKAIGGSVFFIFATFILFSSIYLHFFVPETKDKTISDVQKFFERKKDWRLTIFKNRSLKITISRIHLKLNKIHPDDLNTEPRATVTKKFSSWFIRLRN